MQSADVEGQPRKHITLIACTACQIAKRKCDNATPCCRCINQGVECIRKRVTRYEKTACAAGVDEVDSLICASATRNKQLNSNASMRNLMNAASKYHPLLTFSHLFSDEDAMALYTSKAAQVRTDAAFSMMARGMGLEQLSSEFLQRSLRVSNEVAMDMSNESASALMMLGMAMFGIDINKSRHMFRTCLSMLREINPESSNRRDMIESTADNGCGTYLLFMKGIGSFFNPEFAPKLKSVLKCMIRNRPLVARNVREALKRHNTPANLEPFDMAQYLGMERGEVTAVSSSSSSSSSPSSSPDHDSNKEEGQLPEVNFSKVKEVLEEMGLNGSCVDIHIVHALMQIAMQSYDQGEMDNCRRSAMSAIEILEGHPPAMLVSSAIVSISQLFEISILLEDLKMFRRVQCICSAMGGLPSAVALSKAMEDIPTIYPGMQESIRIEEIAEGGGFSRRASSTPVTKKRQKTKEKTSQHATEPRPQQAVQEEKAPFVLPPMVPPFFQQQQQQIQQQYMSYQMPQVPLPPPLPPDHYQQQQLYQYPYPQFQVPFPSQQQQQPFPSQQQQLPSFQEFMMQQQQQPYQPWQQHGPNNY